MNYYNIQYSPINMVNKENRINTYKKIKIYGSRKIKQNYLLANK
jgi:hypothetical protein